jgi:hypothetical protein
VIAKYGSMTEPLNSIRYNLYILDLFRRSNCSREGLHFAQQALYACRNDDPVCLFALISFIYLFGRII